MRASTIFSYARKGMVANAVLACFSWILVFTWKVRNDKVFNGKDILPLEIVNHTIKEAEEWKAAQVIQEAVSTTATPTFQVSHVYHDAKWMHFGWQARKSLEVVSPWIWSRIIICSAQSERIRSYPPPCMRSSLFFYGQWSILCIWEFYQ